MMIASLLSFLFYKKICTVQEPTIIIIITEKEKSVLNNNNEKL